MMEIDLLGNVIRRWHTTGIEKEVPPESIPIDTDRLHHDDAVLPSGNFLALGSEARYHESYPSSEENAAAPWQPHDVIGHLEGILDQPGYDWAHANSPIYDDRDDSAILSLDHPSAIVEIDLESGDLG